jgi:DNA replication and repair protein RecF
LHLQRLILAEFKSHQSLEAHFGPELNFIVGPNGSGKTNILEAISYLCLGKSAFQPHDRFTPNQGQSGAAFFSTIGWFDSGNDSTDKVQVSQQAGTRKQIKRNDVPYAKMSEHVGNFPVVYIIPDDVYLIRDGAEERRRFFDTLLCQLSQPYLQTLVQYNQYLAQRNALLKQFLDRQYQDLDLLSTYTPPLAALGEVLYQFRKAFAQDFMPHFVAYYQYLSQETETPCITYKTQQDDHQPLAEQLATALQTDLSIGRTTVGPHKDDYEFLLNDQPLKNFGSQGQQKSFLVALKLAQYQVLEQAKGLKPLLLLDDIFDKLDQARITALLQLVSENTFGQIFITDAQPDRCRQWAAGLSAEQSFLVLPLAQPELAT